MTEPTDAELIALLGDRQFSTIGAVREALRRWGTPPAVMGEPIGYLYCGGSYGDELADWEIVADQHQCDKLNEHHGSLGKEAKLPIYAAPQPTQTVPPAGREPLTDAQIAEMMRDTWGCASIAPRHAEAFARAVEAEVRKDYDALIRQMLEALEWEAGSWKTDPERTKSAIAAARARLLDSDLSNLAERGAKAWAGVDAQKLREDGTT